MSLNERGIALPMALIVLMVIASLTTAFTVLATSEPMIAVNHKMQSQARAHAEAGIERALWALSHPADLKGIPDPMGATAPAPYAGNTYMAVSANGGFTVKVTEMVKVNERKVEAIGWTPNDNLADPAPKGVKRIETIVMKMKNLEPPCALCVEGEVEVTGSAKVEAKNSASCSKAKAGTMTTGMTYVGGSGKVYGPDDNVANEPEDMAMNTPPADFEAFKFMPEDIAILKAYAQANGTYYQGSVVFSSSNPMPNGIVFVDTVSGDPFTKDTPDADAGFAKITGATWSGWLIVAGSIQIDGNVTMNGLVYAQNDISYRGTGTGRIEGAVISENQKDDVATTIDATSSGNADIIYNCDYVRNGGGQVSDNWFVKVGTYKELEGYTHN